MQKTADPITSRRVMVSSKPFELYPEQCQCTARLLPRFRLLGRCVSGLAGYQICRVHLSVFSPLTWHELSHGRRNEARSGSNVAGIGRFTRLANVRPILLRAGGERLPKGWGQFRQPELFLARPGK